MWQIIMETSYWKRVEYVANMSDNHAESCVKHVTNPEQERDHQEQEHQDQEHQEIEHEYQEEEQGHQEQ